MTNPIDKAAQPEALRLAAWLNEGCWHQIRLGDVEAAGRELRRLHALTVAQAAQIEACRAGAARPTEAADGESLNSIIFALARLATWNPTEAVLHQIDRLADHFDGEKIGTSFRLLARDARNPKRHPPMTRLVPSAEPSSMKEKTE